MGVWGTDVGEWPEEPTTRIAARPESAPSFSALKEPQLHELLRCVLRGEQEYRRTCPAAEDAASWERRLVRTWKAERPCRRNRQISPFPLATPLAP